MVKIFLILLSSPFVLATACLLALTFFMPLFLIKGFHIISLGILIALLILLAVFILYYVRRQYLSGMKTRRKAFIVGVGLVILAGIIVHTAFNLSSTWVLRRTAKKAQLAGIKLRLEQVIPIEISDQRNAAVVWSRAFKLCHSLYHEHIELQEATIRFNREDPFEELTLREKNVLRKLLLENPEILALFNLVEKATNMPECRFPVNHEEGPNALLPHLSELRELARLFALRIWFLTYQGNYQSAWKSFQTAFAIGDSLKNEPCLVSQQTRFGIESMIISSFTDNLLKKIAPEDCGKLISDVEGKSTTLVDALNGDITTIGGYVFGDIWLGQYKRRKNFIPFVGDVSSEEGGVSLFWRIYGSYFFSPIFKRDASFYLDYSTRFSELFRKPFYIAGEELKKVEKDFRTKNHSFIIAGYFTGQSEHPFYNIYVQQTIYTAYLETLKIACLLEKYRKENGRYPESLEQLVPAFVKELPIDPFTDKNYIYRQENAGFIVYSIGKNLADDRGILDHQQGYDDVSFRVSD